MRRGPHDSAICAAAGWGGITARLQRLRAELRETQARLYTAEQVGWAGMVHVLLTSATLCTFLLCNPAQLRRNADGNQLGCRCTQLPVII